MKKILFAFPILLVMGCNSDVKDIDQTMQGCEKIVSTESHVVYKCPAEQSWVAQVKSLEPNGQWVDFSGLDEKVVLDMAKDTEHVYVEFAFDKPGWNHTCKEKYTMRTMLKGPSADNWAFVGCK